VFNRVCLVLGSVVCLALAGCGGGGGVPATGKVVNGANPYAPGEGESVNVSLASDSGAGGGGTSGKDGTFTLKANDGKDLPPGKYKVSITIYKAASGKGGPPAPVTKPYGDFELSSSNNVLTIDLSKVK
jgi:hypothetical protein